MQMTLSSLYCFRWCGATEIFDISIHLFVTKRLFNFLHSQVHRARSLKNL